MNPHLISYPETLYRPVHNVTILIQGRTAFMDLIKTCIESNYHDANFCAVGLAELMHMSISKLTRKAFELTGYSPAKLILHHRLSMACDLLAQGNEPVKRIAWLTGFQAQASFCRAFVKAFGINPSKYRKNQQTEQYSAICWKVPINLSDAKVLLNRIMQYDWLEKLVGFALSENDHHTASIPKLAQLLNTTPSTLNRKLKELYPITTARFIRDLRLQYASELLGNSDTVTAVAVAAGFFDHSHFCRCFKTVFGTFPSSFKLKKNSEMPVSWLKGKLLENGKTIVSFLQVKGIYN